MRAETRRLRYACRRAHQAITSTMVVCAGLTLVACPGKQDAPPASTAQTAQTPPSAQRAQPRFVPDTERQRADSLRIVALEAAQSAADSIIRQLRAANVSPPSLARPYPVDDSLPRAFTPLSAAVAFAMATSTPDTTRNRIAHRMHDDGWSAVEVDRGLRAINREITRTRRNATTSARDSARITAGLTQLRATAAAAPAVAGGTLESRASCGTVRPNTVRGWLRGRIWQARVLPEANDPAPIAAIAMLLVKGAEDDEYKIARHRKVTNDGYFEFFGVPDTVAIQVVVHSADLSGDHDLEVYYQTDRASDAFGDCLRPESVKLLTYKRRRY